MNGIWLIVKDRAEIKANVCIGAEIIEAGSEKIITCTLADTDSSCCTLATDDTHDVYAIMDEIEDAIISGKSCVIIDLMRFVWTKEHKDEIFTNAFSKAVKNNADRFKCPICGGETHILEFTGGKYEGHKAVCNSCGASQSLFHPIKKRQTAKIQSR